MVYTKYAFVIAPYSILLWSIKTQTMNPETLNTQFGIQNKISFKAFEHTTIATLKSEQATAVVSLYGAHVLSFTPNNEEDVLFVSPHAVYNEGKAIRGGIPICWPWFNVHPLDKSLPSHGFARISTWSVISTNTSYDGVQLELGLSANSDTIKLWPYQFEARLKISLNDKLTVELTTINKDDKPFDVSAALHSYFNISDINTVALEGLEGMTYMDDVANCDSTQHEKELRFGRRADRRYKAVGTTIIKDANRNIEVTKGGSGITVVWNPGEELAMQMPDLLDGYKNMLCVEAANSLDDTITIQAGKQHTLSTTIG